jgi:hypothetical protein
MAIMTKLLAIAVLSVTLPGCFPYATSYVHLEASGITNTAGCAGPPVFANYEARGARIAVTLGPSMIAGTSAGFLRVRAQQDMVVAMDEAFGYLTPQGQAPIRFELRRVERWEDRFGRELDKRQGVLEHRFEFSALPPITFSGSLTLPTLYLDGVAVESPSFKFDRRPYAGVAPLNC